MGEKLPALTAKELIKALEKINIFVVRQRGAHVQLKGVYKNQQRFTTISNHPSQELPIGTINAIMRDCGLTRKELIELIN